VQSDKPSELDLYALSSQLKRSKNRWQRPAETEKKMTKEEKKTAVC
jgi:hypothetical protein